jgi:hypothetical protein
MKIKTLLPDWPKRVSELADDLLARSTCAAVIDAVLHAAFHQNERGAAVLKHSRGGGRIISTRWLEMVA